MAYSSKPQSGNESVESYKHRFAKQVLTGWLREAASQSGYNNYTKLGQFSWKVNRPNPSWGVYEEYPVAKQIFRSGSPVYAWDENGWGDRPPTYEELKAEGTTPLCIVDVAVMNKGEMVYAFEVVHKNPLPVWKTEILRSICVAEIYAIDAEWVLRQVREPKNIQAKLISTGRLFQCGGY